MVILKFKSHIVFRTDLSFTLDNIIHQLKHFQHVYAFVIFKIKIANIFVLINKKLGILYTAYYALLDFLHQIHSQ